MFTFVARMQSMFSQTHKIVNNNNKLVSEAWLSKEKESSNINLPKVTFYCWILGSHEVTLLMPILSLLPISGIL